MNKNVPTSGDYTQSMNPFVFDAVPNNSECLDVGCWTGNLGKELIKKKGCIVDGIDVDASVLKTAKQSGYREVFKVNLNNDPLKLNLEKKYDVIICADVLEHLINPQAVLIQLKKSLNPHGRIIVSLPNVAFILNRILLLLGNWDYREFGTLDKTHLKFYTLQSGVDLVASTGYSVKIKRPYNQFGILRYMGLLTSLFPTLFAYQILITAKKK